MNHVVSDTFQAKRDRRAMKEAPDVAIDTQNDGWRHANMAGLKTYKPTQCQQVLIKTHCAIKT